MVWIGQCDAPGEGAQVGGYARCVELQMLRCWFRDRSCRWWESGKRVLRVRISFASLREVRMQTCAAGPVVSAKKSRGGLSFGCALAPGLDSATRLEARKIGTADLHPSPPLALGWSEFRDCVSSTLGEAGAVHWAILSETAEQLVELTLLRKAARAPPQLLGISPTES